MFSRLIMILIGVSLSNLSFSACGLLCACGVVAGGTMNFGSSFNPTLAGNTDVTGSFTIRCTAVLSGLTADYSATLSQGNSTSFASRTMLNGTTPLAYNVYTTAARTVIWGDGTASTGIITGQIPLLILGGTNQVVNVFGRITGPQPLVTPGSYGDSLTITITF